MGRIVPADIVVGVDLDLQVEAIMAEEHAFRGFGRAAPADALGGVLQSSPGAACQDHGKDAVFQNIARCVRMGPGGQGRNSVEQGAGIGDDLGAPGRIVSLAAGRGLQGVCAIEGVIETAPTSIGGVQGIPAVGDRHDQLGSGQFGDLGIHVPDTDFEGLRLGQEIADFLKEFRLFGNIQGLPLRAFHQASIWTWRSSRRPSIWVLRGVKSASRASSEDQNFAAEIPLSVSSSCSTKACRRSSTESEVLMSM